MFDQLPDWLVVAFLCGLAMLVTLGTMFIAFTYLKLSDQQARTYLYALLFPLFGVVAAAAATLGGWWWLASPYLGLVLIFIIRVDDAPPVNNWWHPWQ